MLPNAAPAYTGRMTAYPIAGYLHLVAGVGLFVALGLEWALLVRLRDAETTEQARSWLKPDLVGSIAVIGVGLALGFLSALPALTREPSAAKLARGSA